VGAFGDEPIGTYAGFQSEGEYCGRGSVEYAGRASWSCGSVEPARSPRAAAFADGVSPISGSVSPTGMGMCADRSPYGFAGWEDEKMKGASRSGPEVATAGCVARDAATASTPITGDPTAIPVPPASPAVTTGSAAMGNVSAKHVSTPASTATSDRTRTAWSAMTEEPRAERIAPVEKTGRCSTGYEAGRAGTSVSAPYGRRASHRNEWRAQKKARAAKPLTEWNPLRTAALGLLAPLILLSGFAVWHHYRVSDRRLGFSHRVVNSEGSGAPDALKGRQK